MSIPFDAAHPNAYSPGRKGRKPSRIVMHTMEGYFGKDGRYSWIKNPNANAAHYYIRRDGYIFQAVGEPNRAHHCKGYNIDSIGIEHEGLSRLAETWTEPMLRASARLVADICKRHAIPIDRQHIRGHSEMRGHENNSDLGKHFPWDRYMQFVREAAGA